MNIDNNLEEIITTTQINYNAEILQNKLDSIVKKMSKYQKLKEMLLIDFEDKSIGNEEYTEYKRDYDNIIKKLQEEFDRTSERLKVSLKNTEIDKSWIEKFKKNHNLEVLNKQIIDELIEYIYIHENGNITIKFKYEDEYVEAIDFIKKHKYDIIMAM